MLNVDDFVRKDDVFMKAETRYGTIGISLDRFKPNRNFIPDFVAFLFLKTSECRISRCVLHYQEERPLCPLYKKFMLAQIFLWNIK